MNLAESKGLVAILEGCITGVGHFAPGTLNQNVWKTLNRLIEPWVTHNLHPTKRCPRMGIGPVFMGCKNAEETKDAIGNWVAEQLRQEVWAEVIFAQMLIATCPKGTDELADKLRSREESFRGKKKKWKCDDLLPKIRERMIAERRLIVHGTREMVWKESFPSTIDECAQVFFTMAQAAIEEFQRAPTMLITVPTMLEPGQGTSRMFTSEDAGAWNIRALRLWFQRKNPGFRFDLCATSERSTTWEVEGPWKPAFLFTYQPVDSNQSLNYINHP